MRYAVLWRNGKISDLNKQLSRGSAWMLESAQDINGSGQIVGQGLIGGQRHGFLIVPGVALQAVSVSSEAVTETIGMDQVQSLLGGALARRQAVGINASADTTINVRIADHGGATLGLNFGDTIYRDDNAADWNWFVDLASKDGSTFVKAAMPIHEMHIDRHTVIEPDVRQVACKQRKD